MRTGKLNQRIRSIFMIMFILSFILVQAPLALAKTSQTSIANPSNDTVVLNVKIGGVTLPYTWGDITGASGYKFAGQETSDIYLIKEETCKGIKLADFLTNLESTLGLKLQDTYSIKAISSDGYNNPAFTVAEVKNAINHYMLANNVNDVSEACIGNNGSVAYPATYLRIARNRGGDFSTDGFGNAAYMRLISSMQISKSDGSAVELANVNLTKNNGIGLGTLIPSTTGLVIGGTGISKGTGLLGSFVYLSQAQIDYIKANKSVDGLGIGSSWTSTPTLYSSYHNHGVPTYKYTLAEGIDLKTTLTALGANVTGTSVAIEAKSSDGYDSIINDAFGYQGSRNYISPDGMVGAAVGPMLVFYENSVETFTPDSSTVLPKTTAAINDPNPLFVYGQKEATESNNCTFVQNTVKIRAGLDTPAFTVSKDSINKSISLSEIALAGIYRTSYYWENSGAQITQNVVGVPLNVLLTKLGISIPRDKGLIINIKNGNGSVASDRTISYSEISKCFVAFDAFENNQRISGSTTPLRIYCPGETQANVLIENVVGASVGEVQSGLEEMTRKTATELNKTWIIRLNKAVDSETVVPKNIYVTYDDNVVVETSLSISQDYKSIAVIPVVNYTPNKEYKLYISNQLQAQDNKKNLNKSLVMPFLIIK